GIDHALTKALEDIVIQYPRPESDDCCREKLRGEEDLELREAARLASLVTLESHAVDDGGLHDAVHHVVQCILDIGGIVNFAKEIGRPLLRFPTVTPPGNTGVSAR